MWIVIGNTMWEVGKVQPRRRQYGTGEPDAARSCLSGSEGAGRKRTAAMRQRAVLRPYLHYALALWFDKVVKIHCRGEALLCRYADDWVCAFRYQDDAERFYRVLPRRLAKFNLQVAPEKTHLRRFSRFHPGMQRRFTFLGFECFWMPDRQSVPRVKRRTARKKLHAACRRLSEWIKQHRHLPGREFFQRLNARLRGHYNDYGVRGNTRSLYRFFNWAMDCAWKWLNRRGGKRASFTWEQFTRILDRIKIARPCITEVRRRRVVA